MSTKRQILTVCACLAALALPHAAAHAQSFALAAKGWTLQHNEILPPVSLRGYGTVGADAARYAAPNGGRVSFLTVSCADVARARLMLAKYASDLHCLGGVTDEVLTAGGHHWKAYHVGTQGWIVAGRSGRKLALASSPDGAALSQALAACPGTSAPTFSQDTGATIPMYLDKFDKYGFGFWYQPGSSPQGQEATYDPVKQDLEYAKKMGVGLQVLLDPDYADSAEGMANFATTGWAVDANRMLGVPTFVQFGGGTASGLWIANRWPDQMQQHAPGFLGDWYGNVGDRMTGPPSHIAFSAGSAEDAENAIIERMVKHYAAYPNVTGYLEPHGEMGESPVDLMLEYGPVADQNYQRYLRGKYQTPQAIDGRWDGGAGKIKTWGDVHLPEVAHFLGYGPQAVDLRGPWKLGYDDAQTAEAKAAWAHPEFDDSKWPSVVEPGSDLVFFLPKKPATFRRSFSLSSEELTRLRANGKVYLYVWDMNEQQDLILKAAVNGKTLPDHVLPFARPDWTAFDVTALVHEGQNFLAIRPPKGFLGYKVYLSPDAPHAFPLLGPALNAQWMDYRDFIAWERVDQMRRTMQAIRRSDPDRFIKLMAPGWMEDLEKQAAADYGGFFHDTGGMSAFFFDDMPALLRSVGKPMSIEPSQGEGDANTMARVFGLNVTEGTNAIDYFPNLGDAIWKPDMKQWFEAHQPVLHMVGKYHMETARVAILHSIRTARLTDYPFTPGVRDADVLNVDVEDHVPYPRDDVTDDDFSNGIADKYSLIIDANTTLMDDAMLRHVEAWVRKGGTFVAYGQTGRDSPDAPDSWPISRLTGYSVKLPSVGPDGLPNNWGAVTAVPGQTVLRDPLWTRGANASGQVLTRVAPECQNVLTWHDGSVAMGVRPLGKGYVVDAGQRTDAGSMLWGQWGNENILFRDLVAWRGLLEPQPHADIPGRTVPFVSNNGLYDVTMVWAESVKQPTGMTLHFPGANGPAVLRDVAAGATLTGQKQPDGMVYPGLRIQPNETRGFLAPHNQITQAPLAWLRLQRDWWGGTLAPPPAPPLEKPSGHTIDLSQGWSFRPLGLKDDAQALLGLRVPPAPNNGGVGLGTPSLLAPPLLGAGGAMGGPAPGRLELSQPPRPDARDRQKDIHHSRRLAGRRAHPVELLRRGWRELLPAPRRPGHARRQAPLVVSQPVRHGDDGRHRQVYARRTHPGDGEPHGQTAGRASPELLDRVRADAGPDPRPVRPVGDLQRRAGLRRADCRPRHVQCPLLAADVHTGPQGGRRRRLPVRGVARHPDGRSGRAGQRPLPAAQRAARDGVHAERDPVAAPGGGEHDHDHRLELSAEDGRDALLRAGDEPVASLTRLNTRPPMTTTTKVHLIFNAHLDPVWLWPWQAGLDEALATCRSACDRMDKHPDLTFTRGEAWIYRQIERTDPELFERIRQHVQSGRWQIVNGWWIQPDCNAPSEWGFERQIEAGRDFFLDRFGIFPRIGFNVDSFGHCATLPSLLRRYGQDRYVMMRPENHEAVLPHVFHWRGAPDEEPVTVYRINSGYAAWDLSEELILRSTQGLPPGLGHAACFVGVGDHGGGPTEDLIAWYRANKDSVPGCTLLLSSLSNFFDGIDAYEGTLPDVTGELQQHAVGCYSVYRPIHVSVRRAEHLLRQAECLRDDYPEALESPPKTAEDLKDAWEQVCFAHFHDILGGTSIPSAYPIILDQLGLARAKADDLLQIGLRRLYQTIPDDTQQRLVLLNASDHPFDGYAEFEPWLQFSGWKPGWGLLDGQGQPVAFQAMNPEETAFGHGKADPATLSHPRLLFPVRLAAGELSALRIAEAPPAPPPVHPAKSEGRRLSSGDVAWEDGRLSLPGGLTIAPALELIADPTDTWSHPLSYPGAYTGYPQEAVGAAVWESHVERVDSGPLMASFLQEGTIGASRLTAEWRVYADLPFVELLLRVFWLERHHVLKLCVDYPGAAAERMDGIPGRSLARPNDAREMPLRDWTLVETASGPLGVAAPDVFALDGTPSRLRLTLLRSPLMANHDPYSLNPDRKTLDVYRKTYTDDGVHDFRFRFFGGAEATAARLDRETMGMQRPLLMGDLTKGMPMRPILTR